MSTDGDRKQYKASRGHLAWVAAKLGVPLQPPKNKCMQDGTGNSLEAGSADVAIDELLKPCPDFFVHIDGGNWWVPVPYVVVYSHESHWGSRTVQKALHVASPSQLFWLASALNGFIAPLAKSKHANFVIQKLLVAMRAANVPTWDAEQEIFKDLDCMTSDKYGCRVVKHVLDSHRVVDWVLEKARELSEQEFGHFIVETVLERPDIMLCQKAVIIKKLMSGGLGVHLRGKCCFVIKKIIQLGLLGQLLPQLLTQTEDINVLGSWRLAEEQVKKSPKGCH